jgi:hypothetical protein
MMDAQTIRLIINKGVRSRVLHRIMVERLTEPLHLNLASAFVAAFGTFRAKVSFDLVYKQPYAWGILQAADQAKDNGHKSVTVVEAGVASGAGLMSMARIAARAAKVTGIDIRVVGLDGGIGMPPPQDYRDHPDLYLTGDYPMDETALRKALPAHCSLLVGPLKDVVAQLLAQLEGPIGFLSADLDYFSSTLTLLDLFTAGPDQYLTAPMIYFDDVCSEKHNMWCGELAAIEEFNRAHEFRKIDRYRFLRSERIFKNARWIDQIYVMHPLDHPWRQKPYNGWSQRILGNYFLSGDVAHDKLILPG